jgi:hypothetical protein
MKFLHISYPVKLVSLTSGTLKLSFHLFITKKFNYSSLDKLYNTDQKCLICS